MKAFIVLAIAALAMLHSGCSRSVCSLQDELERYVAAKDATIGIGVIIDGRDTVAVNGHRAFPMLSVYKFPITVALGELSRTNAVTTPSNIVLSDSVMCPGTYSPMHEKYAGQYPMTVSVDEVIRYALQLSDNNASDILLNLAGGAEKVDSTLRDMGIEGIAVKTTEREMYADPQRCYDNHTTPLAMASLADRFDRESHDPYSLMIKGHMENCETGTDRLARPVREAGATIGHKTGTGFVLPDGKLMAVNDAGYVRLPDGRRYAIAVFVENSAYSMAETEALIADISKIVLESIKNKQIQ